jgi:hypothetical protein
MMFCILPQSLRQLKGYNHMVNAWQNSLDLVRLGMGVLWLPRVNVLNPSSALPTSAETALDLARAGDWARLKQAAFVVPDDQANARAFWLNLYNALTLHAISTAGIRDSVLESLGFFSRYAYRVGEQTLSLNQIEHGILRGNRAALIGLPPFASRNPRVKWVLPLEPRIHFALNCGAASCPPIRAYVGANLEQQLELATHSYLSECRFEAGVVWLPRLLSYYPADFGNPLEFARRYRPNLPAVARVRYLPYSWAKTYR